MIGLGEDQNPIVVDFFAGSGTTAAAALQLSSETGRNLRWLLVQIADPCEDGSAAYRAGFATIADFTKERIRSEEHTSELQSLMRISYAVFCLNKQKYTISH